MTIVKQVNVDNTCLSAALRAAPPYTTPQVYPAKAVL